MKPLLILSLSIIIAACEQTPHHKVQSKTKDETWQIKKITTRKHLYNKAGLPDTTFQVLNYYVKGKLSAIINSLITRKYDSKSNLINEKIFQVLNTKSILSEEKLFSYDTKNNLVLMTDRYDGAITEIVKTGYINKQKEEEIIIKKSLDPEPESWNLDSAIAHKNDKKALHYDTSRISYKYDTKGNLVKKVYKKFSGEINTIHITLYSDTIKTMTYGINSKNDTVSVTKYEKDGDLIAETGYYKYMPFFSDTILYAANRKVQEVHIDKKNNYQRKETYKYDSKGNEIENITYQ